MENNKDKLIDNLAKLFVHVTSDSFEKASKNAVIVCFAVKYAIVTLTYILLRNCVGLAYGEIWMAVVLAFALYGDELYINTKVKEGLVKSILEEKEFKNEEENAEDAKHIEASEEEKTS